jgi:acyl-coenzyme A synthetase/AMP-(fatty) acid ligase
MPHYYAGARQFCMRESLLAPLTLANSGVWWTNIKYFFILSLLSSYLCSSSLLFFFTHAPLIAPVQVKGLFCAPTAIRAIKREDPNATYVSKYSTESLKFLWLAGERGDPGNTKKSRFFNIYLTSHLISSLK